LLPVIFILLNFTLADSLRAQPSLEFPRTSQHATVTQKIGITDITITYFRPGVKGREIWGGLVPFGEVWRLGANNKTTITFTDPVTMGGKPLPAGTYALHMIPGAESATVIVSGNTTGWGTQYDEKDDIIRLELRHTGAGHTEWMEFSFTDLTDTGATIALSWADRRYPLPVAVATPEVVLEHARTEFAAGQDSVTWEILRQAAAYAYRQDLHLAEALSWTERSLAIRRTLPGLSLRADILARTGKTDAAAAAVNEAVAGATEADMISYARQLRRDGRADRALELLLKFSERTDDSWMTNRALGEAYEAMDDPVSARKQYEVALENAPEGKERDRVRELITNLGAK
jgi:hypothetical protein